MCGIAGYFTTGSLPECMQGRLSYALQALKHRGPDDEGKFCSSGNSAAPKVIMGMRRLAIQDPVNGKQPVFSEDRSVVAVFNGEIYNYRELQSMLSQRGHNLASNSDSEVIVHLYEEYGIDFLKELNGMFAIALWDERKGIFILARDPMGIKPLFYSAERGDAETRIYFSSEVDSLQILEPSQRKIDIRSLKTYLTLGYTISPRTLLKGINSLRPGEALLVGREEFKQFFFHQPTDESESINSMKVAVDAVDGILKETLERQLRSDVPLGIFLSGGIDSGIIAAYANLVAPAPRPAFFLGFSEKSYDEEELARLTASRCGLEFIRVEMKVEEIDWNKILRMNDQPNMDFSIVNSYVLSCAARERVKTVIGGDGGDELFGGYQTYQANLWANDFDRILPNKFWKLGYKFSDFLPASYNKTSIDFFFRSFSRGMLCKEPLVRHLAWRRHFTNEEILEIMPFLQDIYSCEVLEDEIKDISLSKFQNQVHSFLSLDHKAFLEGETLTKTDRGTMAASLESRVPLLDLALLRISEKVNGNLILNRSKTKLLLREVAKIRLPKEIVSAPKSGFTAPIPVWLKENKIEPAQRLFKREPLQSIGMNPIPVLKLWNEHISGKANHGRRLWTILSLVDWATRHNYDLRNGIL